MAATLAGALVVLLAGGLACWLQPWRALPATGPPWPWWLLWALLPLLWTPLPLQPLLSGAVLLVLLTGWPLAVLALLGVALFAALAGALPWHALVPTLMWQGLVPATLALGVGALTRRWWPQRLLGYLLGRAFAGTWLALMLAAGVAWPVQVPHAWAWSDWATAQALAGFCEAMVTAAGVAALVALRPQWLATYSERLYPRPLG